MFILLFLYSPLSYPTPSYIIPPLISHILFSVGHSPITISRSDSKSKSSSSHGTIQLSSPPDSKKGKEKEDKHSSESGGTVTVSYILAVPFISETAGNQGLPAYDSNKKLVISMYFFIYRFIYHLMW